MSRRLRGSAVRLNSDVVQIEFHLPMQWCKRMTWTRTDLKRSYVCNQGMLKFFRERRTWSQQQLSEHSGVSVRVVSKAEAGETVSKSSIDSFAGALSTAEHEIFPEDLISFPRELAEKFVDALYVHKAKMMEVFLEFVDPDAVFYVIGDPKKLPFAGKHQGPRAYRRALRKYFEIFDFVPGFDHANAFEYFPSGTDVVLWGESLVRLIGSDAEPIKVQHRQRLRFRRGLLYSYEDHFDTDKGEKDVATAAEVLGDKVYDPLEDSGFSMPSKSKG